MSAYSETADIETSSESYATRFAGEVGQWFLEVQEQITLSLLDRQSIHTILDVGGGHGQLARPLTRQGFDVTVVGSDTSCAARTSDLQSSGRFKFQTGDVINLPFPDDSFDTVISFRLLPHCTQWQKLISELCRVARKQVIIDYPPLFSSNLLYKILFPLKLALEGNTRTYTIFSDKEVMNEFRRGSFVEHKRIPEFFLPMVAHRKLKNRKISSSLEAMFRGLGLTSIFGSPTILSCMKQDRP